MIKISPFFFVQAFCLFIKTKRGLRIDKEAFYEDVYSIVRQITFGRVCTYGWIARSVSYTHLLSR